MLIWYIRIRNIIAGKADIFSTLMVSHVSASKLFRSTSRIKHLRKGSTIESRARTISFHNFHSTKPVAGITFHLSITSKQAMSLWITRRSPSTQASTMRVEMLERIGLVAWTRSRRLIRTILGLFRLAFQVRGMRLQTSCQNYSFLGYQA